MLDILQVNLAIENQTLIAWLTMISPLKWSTLRIFSIRSGQNVNNRIRNYFLSRLFILSAASLPVISETGKPDGL